MRRCRGSDELGTSEGGSGSTSRTSEGGRRNDADRARRPLIDRRRRGRRPLTVAERRRSIGRTSPRGLGQVPATARFPSHRVQPGGHLRATADAEAASSTNLSEAARLRDTPLVIFSTLQLRAAARVTASAAAAVAFIIFQIFCHMSTWRGRRREAASRPGARSVDHRSCCHV